MSVETLPEVKEYLNNLITILYEKDYFGFEETAWKYADDLLNDIITTLHLRLYRPAPNYFDKYGKNMQYAIFRKNKRTTWYAFFTKYRQNEEIIYLIRYIANNHIIAQYL